MIKTHTHSTFYTYIFKFLHMRNLYIMHKEPSAALIMWNSRIGDYPIYPQQLQQKSVFAIQVLSRYLATCTRLWHGLSRSILIQAVCQCTHYSPPHLVERGRMFVQWQWARHTPSFVGTTEKHSLTKSSSLQEYPPNKSPCSSSLPPKENV